MAAIVFPLQVKSGFAQGTEGVCVGWEPTTVRYGLIRGQKEKYDALSLQVTELQGELLKGLGTVCGKYETHKLYLL